MEKNEYWINCPIRKKSVKAGIRKDMILIHFPFHCLKRKQRALINAVQLKVMKCGEERA